MKMARLTVRVLETESPLAEVHLAGDAGVHHPLQRAVDRGPADAMVVAPDEIDQIVRAQVPFLAEEDVDNLLPLARALAPERFKAREIGQGLRHAGLGEMAGQESPPDPQGPRR